MGDLTIALPNITLSPRPGKLVQLRAAHVEDYQWGERHYTLTIIDEQDGYTARLDAELRHQGKTQVSFPLGTAGDRGQKFANPAAVEVLKADGVFPRRARLRRDLRR
jgi:hypothetical protein